MSNHSPEAEIGLAQYRADNPYEPIDSDDYFAGFDAGVAATHAKQHAATKRELVVAIQNAAHYDPDGHDFYSPVEVADALLATPGPLLDAAGVRQDAQQEIVRWLDGHGWQELSTHIRTNFDLTPAKGTSHDHH